MRSKLPTDFEEIFGVHYAPLVAALAAAAGSPEDAADAVQDAFVQAYRHWDRISDYQSKVAWVRRVAVNRIANQHRGRRRRSSALSQLAPLSRLARTDDDDGEGKCVQLVAHLPPRQRLVVSLHYVADMSVDDIAAALTIASGTVKSQLHEARATLRVALEVGGNYEQ